MTDANPFLTDEHGMFETDAENLQRKVREDIAAYLGAQEADEIAPTAGSPCGPQECLLVSTEVGHDDLRIGELRFAQRDDLNVVAERSARLDELTEIQTDASELEEGGGKQKDSQQTNKSIVTSNRLRPVWNSVGVD